MAKIKFKLKYLIKKFIYYVCDKFDFYLIWPPLALMTASTWQMKKPRSFLPRRRTLFFIPYGCQAPQTVVGVPVDLPSQL